MSALVQNDVALFYEQEITSRENAALPPFGRLAGVIISGTDQRATEHFARQFALAAPRIAGVILLGPAEAPITLIRGRYRFRLLVKTPRLFPLQSMMRDWLKCAPRPHGHIKITVDIDPYSFM
jgi:primosomal protein N' (replication factor Y)